MVEARSLRTTAAACQNVMNVRATVVATTTLVAVVDGILGTLVCMSEYHVMSVAPQNPCQPLFAGRPPAFPSADHYQGIGLQYPANGFGKIPAKVHLYS